jgi:CRP-like cAMP-binding protein
MEEETMDRFLGLMKESVVLNEGEALIPFDKCDNSIYVLKSGIIRSVYFDGVQERTFFFALAGTVLISYYAFYRRLPAFFQLEACCDSVVMKVEMNDFLALVKESNDFAQWMMWMSIGQLWFHEMKLSVVNGDARERFESLVKNRPEVVEKVASRILASYIGITPQYLSKLKREFLTGAKK